MRVIPNYVVTDVFRPMPDIDKEYDLACVAKSAPQKNIDGLLAALARLKAQGALLRLLLIGGCSTDDAVRRMAATQGLDVTFAGNVANYDLPRRLNQARAFVLPSHYEGHPKVLLEAMSCELPCIGTEVDAIKEEIRHQETGYLCQTSPESLAATIDRVLKGSPEALSRAGEAARQHVVGSYSVDRVLEMELDVLRSLHNGDPTRTTSVLP